MAKRPTTGSEGTEELPSATESRLHGPVIEFDPQASNPAGELALASAASVGTLETGADLLQARDALESLLTRSMSFAAAASQASAPESLGLQNIQAIGVGIRRTAGGYTGEVVLKVFVQEKAPAARIQASALVPEDIDGVPIDVEEIGEIRAQVYKSRYPRPVPCGVSCGHVEITAGTIGCLVVLNNNRLCLLSNNHVLANENRARLGDPIIQPGSLDGGAMPSDRIGTLERFIPLSFTGPNLVDAAVAWTASNLVSTRHVTYALNPVPLATAIGLPVLKNGRTTQATQGQIIAHHVNNVRVGYSQGTALFNEQVIIRGLGSAPFSQPGDSGSLIVSAGSKQPVALLFAGSATHTIASPIATVIAQLGIDRFVAG